MNRFGQAQQQPQQPDQSAFLQASTQSNISLINALRGGGTDYSKYLSPGVIAQAPKKSAGGGLMLLVILFSVLGIGLFSVKVLIAMAGKK
jgi:hypothetical protein